MRLRILPVLTALSVGALGIGHASNLGLSTGGLGAGSAAIPECDTDGFTTTYTVSSGVVTAVSVGGIADPACEGGALSVTLTDSGNISIGSGGPVTVPTDGDAVDNSAIVSINPQPPAPQVANIHISIVGP